MVKILPEMQIRVWSLSQEDPLEKDMATHSNILAWRIPWTEEPGGLESMGSQKVRHDWVTNAFKSMDPVTLLCPRTSCFLLLHKPKPVCSLQHLQPEGSPLRDAHTSLPSAEWHSGYKIFCLSSSTSLGHQQILAPLGPFLHGSKPQSFQTLAWTAGAVPTPL